MASTLNCVRRRDLHRFRRKNSSGVQQNGCSDISLWYLINTRYTHVCTVVCVYSYIEGYSVRRQQEERGGQRWPVKRRWSLKTQVRVPFYPRSTLSCSINRRHLELMYRKRTEKEKDLSQSSQTERMTGLAPLRFWPHLDRPTGPRPSGRAAGCKRFLKKGCEYCDRFLCMCHVGQNEESS